MAVGLMTPTWLSAATRNNLKLGLAGGKAVGKRVLVVCQLSGGNDGLNTVVPYRDAAYRKLRPTLALPENDLVPVGDSAAFHPSLDKLAELFREGKLSVVQGVGYPNATRSHFKSMDIWQTADPERASGEGWLGRHFDLQKELGKYDAVSGVGISIDPPRALSAHDMGIPCFASLTDVETMVGEPDMERMLREMQGEGGSNAERTVRQANQAALDAMNKLQSRLSAYTPKQDYGDSQLGRAFRQAAHLVATSPETQVVYLSAGGFDTHARQLDSHARLLGQFGQAVHAFQREIESIGRGQEVSVMAFSEFGRRASENASQGTDHGKAGPMFVVGQGVAGGFLGQAPALDSLDEGDVPFSIDFRRVYATLLDDWMGSDSGKILGTSFEKLPLFRA